MDCTDLILNATPSYISYKNTNWENFRRDLENASQHILPSAETNLSNEDIDGLVDSFNSCLNSIHDAHSQIITISNGLFPLSERFKRL